MFLVYKFSTESTVLLYFVFDSTGDQAQGLAHVRQAQFPDPCAISHMYS